MVWGRRRDFLPGSQEVKWRDGTPPTNAWLPGFITAYNTRFGRDPANAKDLHRPLTPADDLDEILAWREERTLPRNLTLHYDRMMLLLDPNISGPSLGAPAGGGWIPPPSRGASVAILTVQTRGPFRPPRLRGKIACEAGNFKIVTSAPK